MPLVVRRMAAFRHATEVQKLSSNEFWWLLRLLIHIPGAEGRLGEKNDDADVDVDAELLPLSPST